MIPDLTVSVSSAGARVRIAVAGDEVYDETLTPVSGIVTVTCMPDLITPHLRGVASAVVTIGIDEVDASGAVVSTLTPGITFTAVYSMAEITGNMTVDDVLASSFLSMVSGTRMTRPGRVEYLYYIGNEDAVVTAIYSDGSRRTFQVTGTVSEGRTVIDVSPDAFNTSGKTLVAYVVICGSRSQTYHIDFSPFADNKALAFRNSFGVTEVAYLSGARVMTLSHKRDSVRINSLLRNYNIDETRSYKCDSGILTVAMVALMEDLLRSDDVCEINWNGSVWLIGRPVVVTDSKAEISDEDDELARVTLTWQYSQRLHNFKSVTPLQVRIFDYTFDFTFG